MSLQYLIDMMEPPARPVDAEGDWSAVEEALGTWLPQDYKSFMSVYGSGSINGFLTIFSPFAQDEDLNLALGSDDDLAPGFWPFSTTGLMLGDMGSVYVFVCRHCEGWPVNSMLQMT